MTFLRLLSLLLLLTTVAAQCFEPLTNPTEYQHRYRSQEIYAVDTNASNVVPVRVWVNTPSCTYWAKRGCIDIRTQTGVSCDSLGSLLPVLHSRCYPTYNTIRHTVYDQHAALLSSSPAYHKICSCWALWC